MPELAPQPASVPAWALPPQRTGTTATVVLAVVGIVVGGLLLLAVLAYIAVALGVGPVLASTVLALLPLTALLLVVRWIDRWEPEPRGALWFALLWGAGVAAVLSLLVELGLSIAGTLASADAAPSEALSTVVQAPIVEEVAKGLGVLILAFAVRRYFDTPVDGIVYAAMIAAGFTFTEDVLYFAAALGEGGGSGLAATFVMRGIMSPFAHMMFTACTGYAVGWAVQRTSGAGIVGWWLVGLVAATGLHMLWNGATVYVPDFIGYYLVVQVPLFVLAVVLVLIVRRHEVRVTQERLGEYEAAGWFAPGEVAWLSTPAGRRAARRWAAAQPGDKRAVMRRFTLDATRLAFARQKAATGRAGIGYQHDEQELLASITRDRAALLSSG